MPTYPFGQPLTPVIQTDRRPKRVFVLGVYASAVHGPLSATVITKSRGDSPGFFYGMTAKAGLRNRIFACKMGSLGPFRTHVRRTCGGTSWHLPVQA